MFSHLGSLYIPPPGYPLSLLPHPHFILGYQSQIDCEVRMISTVMRIFAPDVNLYSNKHILVYIQKIIYGRIKSPVPFFFAK